MQKISRIHLANCGFRTAWYEAVTFNLTEQGTGLPTDTIINLENGGGKTTLLGLVFSCFETSQERFLKHIQSKHNSFSQYFTHDGVPGFIVIEWLMPARSWADSRTGWLPATPSPYAPPRRRTSTACSSASRNVQTFDWKSFLRPDCLARP